MITIITDHWNSYLESFEGYQKDIYYYEEYVRLYETDSNKALCIVCTEDDRVLLMPYLRGEIDGYYDFETAYGYGGPISNTKDTAWLDRAFASINACFIKEKYICGFIRFHSLLENAEYCKDYIRTIFDRSTVAISTDVSEEKIWTEQIVSKNRNMIRKAEKNGLEYVAEYDFASMPDFIKLYNATMQRLGAEDFYYFTEEYYKGFVEKFKDHSFLGTVRKDGELICGALFMYSECYGHYHLEGSNHDYSSLGANNYLLWKTAVEMHNKGIREFHLGGGYNSQPDNSLLKFKKAFSSNIKDFYIGKWIFNEQKYNEVRDKWMEQYPDKAEKLGNLLLCYRY